MFNQNEMFASPILNDPDYISVVRQALESFDREKELREELLKCCCEGGYTK